MKSIAVFCGSGTGIDKVFAEQAKLLGQTLARRNIAIVYGGAKVGLMGALADGALSENGRVTGVIPYFLKGKEIAHDKLTELIVVKTMHERKMKMNELSDGVIAMPGGYGTLEELFEMITWAQLGLHKKPVAIFNIAGYYDHLVALLQSMTDKGLLKETNRNMLLVSDNIEDLLELMDHYVAPDVEKWVTKKGI
ncbi:MAG: TIGR00730 family Rossman fold protein [Bacteroidales bacterium]|nr:TIGR00730 family Rossman fold protein [Bacteroidales bacterium]MBN2761991.1 TIGR00730 family Rossman fold protein [Bacteroidales bacterium]